MQGVWPRGPRLYNCPRPPASFTKTRGEIVNWRMSGQVTGLQYCAVNFILDSFRNLSMKEWGSNKLRVSWDRALTVRACALLPKSAFRAYALLPKSAFRAYALSPKCPSERAAGKAPDWWLLQGEWSFNVSGAARPRWQEKRLPWRGSLFCQTDLMQVINHKPDNQIETQYSNITFGTLEWLGATSS